MADHLAQRPGVVAVLFYGNLHRDPGAGGLLDLYVLTEGDAAYHGVGLAALANRVLPPNVYHEVLADGPRAKVAVMRLEAFAARMRPLAWDTTLWARFTQPSALLYALDDRVRAEVLEAILAAHRSAASWAVALAGPDASSVAAWEALFTHTYGAELRVEGGGRARMLAERGGALFEMLHAEATPATSDAPRAWALRRRLGKLLNAARLIKAAFTFRGGLAYALDKVERHSGRPVELSPWEKRHPALAVPFVVLRLLRERRLR
ncbi:MAG: hypothetical protein AAGI70_13210 [Pseudomonadota bacterium]